MNINKYLQNSLLYFVQKDTARLPNRKNIAIFNCFQRTWLGRLGWPTRTEAPHKPIIL